MERQTAGLHGIANIYGVLRGQQILAAIKRDDETMNPDNDIFEGDAIFTDLGQHYRRCEHEFYYQA